MTKSKSQFASLPEDHRNLILNLCSSRPYDEVVDLLAKPLSEGGLGIVTSKSALCRFFTTTFADSSISVLSQCAAAVNIHQELDANAFLGAIRASVAARVFEMLKNGKALSDMEKDFRLLKTAESLYLADARFRATNPKSARPAYQALVKRSLDAPDFDFTLVDELPTQNENSDQLSQLSEFDQDVNKAREEQKLDAARRAQIFGGIIDPKTGGLDRRIPTQHTNPAPHSASERAKNPVIPHIPANPTSRSATQPPSTAAPANNEKVTPVPTVRATPKIGRNDGCPCGSGRKFKKCCERLGSTIQQLDQPNPPAPHPVGA